MMTSRPNKPTLKRLTPVGVALLYVVFAALWVAASGYLLSASVAYPVLHGRIEVAAGLLFVAVTVSATVVMLWRQKNRTHALELQSRAMAVIEESERRFRAVTQSAHDAIVSADSAGNIVSWNQGAGRIFGHTEAGISGQAVARLMPERYREQHAVQMKRVVDGGEPHTIGKTVELVGLRKDGCEFPLELALAKWETSDGLFFTATMRDITARKADEARIRRLTQLYSVLSQCNQAIVRCIGEAELFQKICCDAVKFGGMKMAWIGLVDETINRVRVAASCGDDKNYLEGILISLDVNEPGGHGPTGTAIRENRPYWCQDFQHDPNTAPWHERGAQSGWGASAALPLRREGAVVGALTLYEGEMNTFDKEARELLEEMTMDIDFALDNFVHEARREQAEKEVRLLSERLTLATDAAAIGIWDWDIRTDHWHASPTYFTMLGYEPEAGLLDRAVWLERTHPDDRDKVAEKIRAVLGGSDVPYQYEARIRHADGTFRWINVIGRVVERDENGRSVRLLGVRMDVTERKQAEVEISEQLDELRRWQEVTTGREGRILDLKHEVNELLAQAGEQPRYPSAEPQHE